MKGNDERCYAILSRNVSTQCNFQNFLVIAPVTEKNKDYKI